MLDKLFIVYSQVKSFGRDQQGAIAVIVAILLPVLAGGLALAIDLSRVANLQTELQDHVDAAALAGATQLDNTDGSRERAIQAAAGALALAVNSQRFGDTTESAIVVDSTVNVPVDGVAVNPDIRFYVDLENKVDATSDEEANFIEVTVQPRQVSYFFAGLVSQITQANPMARAIAGYERLICGIQPLMICNPNGTAAFDVNDFIGAGLFMKAPEGNSLIPGEFAYLQVVGPNGNSTNESICQALASTSPSPICLGTQIDGKGGNITSLHECVNSRLGIYQKNSGWETLSQYQPDVNPVKGLIHDGSNECDSNPVGVGGAAWERPSDLGVPYYQGPGVTPLDQIVTTTYPRDTCAYASGGGACDFDNGGTQVGDGLWDVDAYAYVQHGGITGLDLVAAVVAGGYDNAPFNPPGTLENITRKEVYDYEVGTSAMTATMTPDADVDTGDGCWSGGTPLPVGGFAGSRRMITAAVINCPDANPNKKDLPQSEPTGAVDLFIIEGIGGVTPNNFYAEIVGPAGSENLTAIVEERVVLYE